MNYEEQINLMKKNPKLTEYEKLIKERDILQAELKNQKIKLEIRDLRGKLNSYSSPEYSCDITKVKGLHEPTEDPHLIADRLLKEIFGE